MKSRIGSQRERLLAETVVGLACEPAGTRFVENAALRAERDEIAFRTADAIEFSVI